MRFYQSLYLETVSPFIIKTLRVLHVADTTGIRYLSNAQDWIQKVGGTYFKGRVLLELSSGIDRDHQLIM